MGESSGADLRAAFDRRTGVQFQGAKVMVSKELFEQILERIWALAPGAG